MKIFVCTASLQIMSVQLLLSLFFNLLPPSTTKSTRKTIVSSNQSLNPQKYEKADVHYKSSHPLMRKCAELNFYHLLILQNNFHHLLRYPLG